MTYFKSVCTVAAVFFALPAFAEGITISDAYARSSAMMSQSGAAFMVIQNDAEADDRLLSASSDAAKMVQLHTHKQDASGVMQMIEVPEGFVVPAKGTHALARGADHVMFMGLSQPWKQGDVLHLTLTFEKAGEVKIDVPVDLTREE